MVPVVPESEATSSILVPRFQKETAESGVAGDGGYGNKRGFGGRPYACADGVGYYCH